LIEAPSKLPVNEVNTFFFPSNLLDINNNNNNNKERSLAYFVDEFVASTHAEGEIVVGAS